MRRNNYAHDVADAESLAYAMVYDNVSQLEHLISNIDQLLTLNGTFADSKGWMTQNMLTQNMLTQIEAMIEILRKNI